MRYKNPLERVLSATRYSLQGLYAALKEEQAFEYEAVVLVVIAACALSLGLSAEKTFLLTAAWLPVMCFELVNSAVERAFDLITQERRQEIKEGKDMLSAAVFIAISGNVVLWALMILRYFFA